jgi:hypothetical protein
MSRIFFAIWHISTFLNTPWVKACWTYPMSIHTQKVKWFILWSQEKTGKKKYLALHWVMGELGWEWVFPYGLQHRFIQDCFVLSKKNSVSTKFCCILLHKFDMISLRICSQVISWTSKEVQSTVQHREKPCFIHWYDVPWASLSRGRLGTSFLGWFGI